MKPEILAMITEELKEKNLKDREAFLTQKVKERLNDSLMKYQKEMDIAMEWILTRNEAKVLKTMKRLTKDYKEHNVYEKPVE